jgi:transposase
MHLPKLIWLPQEEACATELVTETVKAAKAGKLHPPGAKSITPEQMELSRVRAENARLRMDIEIFKKATAYFAKDAL